MPLFDCRFRNNWLDWVDGASRLRVLLAVGADVGSRDRVDAVDAAALVISAATGTGIFDNFVCLLGNEAVTADDDALAVPPLIGVVANDSGELFRHSTISRISMRFSPS